MSSLVPFKLFMICETACVQFDVEEITLQKCWCVLCFLNIEVFKERSLKFGYLSYASILE